MTARGDIRWFRFGHPDKRRPVLVLGRPESIPSLSQIVVVPCSTTIRGLPGERWREVRAAMVHVLGLDEG